MRPPRSYYPGLTLLVTVPYQFSLWPKGLLSSQLRQQLKRVPCIRDIIEDSRGELSVQGVSTKGESVDLDDVLEANAVREYERLVVNL